ncbi:MAG TPA: 30S ribosomal protein S16 [Candidatus Saccharimonadales bacterium]|nr:30S ribosomal protein S16 [Candidatus Saccharimonadales bacterium]
MLAIRLQRTGRSGHSQFRLIAQDSRFSPKRGRVVAYLGNYNPHTKEAKLDTDKIVEYLSNGAQPSSSAAKLLSKEGIKLPGWVKTPQPKERSVRNAEKRRSTRPAEPEAPTAETETAAQAETPAEEAGEAEAEPADEAAQPAVPAESETAAAEEKAASPEADTTETTETPAEQA